MLTGVPSPSCPEPWRKVKLRGSSLTRKGRRGRRGAPFRSALSGYEAAEAATGEAVQGAADAGGDATEATIEERHNELFAEYEEFVVAGVIKPEPDPDAFESFDSSILVHLQLI